jgi:preprotein translocase subunit SecD
VIGSTAVLELALVEDGPFPDENAARAHYGGTLPSGLEIVHGDETLADRAGTAGAVYAVSGTPVVTGRDLRTAQPGLDLNNLPIVRFTLTQGAAERFGQVTGENVGQRLAIVLDGEAISVATIEGRITSEGQIQGGFTSQEAQDLALTLRSGALPASLDLLYRGTVGPSLGADSIRDGVAASALGLALVLLFMLVYYRATGVNAVVSVVLNLVILLGLMAALGAEMTLPGIAGFVLTIGIGVDSNVLIFERIKEELPAAKSIRAAVNAGFDRVWWTIVDTHVASLIAAAFLFQFGTGPIRGFATTLTVGLLSNVFTAVFVSRTVFGVMLARRREKLSI